VYQGFVARNFKDTVIYQKSTPEAVTPLSQYTASTPPTLPKRPVLDKKSTQQINTPLKAPPSAAAVTPKSPSLPRPPVSSPKPPAAMSGEDSWKQAKQAADLRNWGEALKWLDRAEEEDKFRPETHYLRGLIALESGNVNDAVRLLRRSVYCDVNFSLAHYTLGDIYAQQGAQKEAARHWKQALAAVEALEPKHILPYSDDLTVEQFMTSLEDRLIGL
jgi:hypothetical protein